jgi:nitrate reductase delta subunit
MALRAARRQRKRAEAETVYALCSLLLQYPDEETLAAHEELRALVAELPGSPAAESLARFLDWWESTNPIEIAQHYVETVDLHKRSGLYLTFYSDGDRRERGRALLRLKRLYRAAGLPLEGGGELPDYLPVMLEFAASAPGGRGEIVLREHRAALELVRLGLRDLDSPYAALLDAVCETVGAASAGERALARKLAKSGPPQELVGLEPFAPPEVMPAVEARR